MIRENPEYVEEDISPEDKKFYVPREKRKKKYSGRRAMGRLIGDSPRGVNTKKRWILARLDDPIDLVRELKGLRLSEIYRALDVGQNYPEGLEFFYR